MKKAYQLKQASDAPDQAFSHGDKEAVRINKYLSASGYCSRRQADRLVEEGRVSIDGLTAVTGSQVAPGQEVAVDGNRVESKAAHVYIALYKPAGITCTVEPDVAGNIGDFMAYPERIFPIGRLDKDSTGLILLTSDGDIVNKILRAENNHDKEYIVSVNRDIGPKFLKNMAEGVEITNTKTKTRVMTNRSQVKQLGSRTFSIVLNQGLNRQIRRMCTELGYRVTDLHRVRIMNISIGSLKAGQWRYLTREELTILEDMIK